jgi:hypothetical protein
MSAGVPNFSPSLTLAGMDYIAPSAACIKPTLMTRTGDGSSGGAVGLQKGGNQVSSLLGGNGGDRQHTYVVKITLQDCLACSGCVTTAETVLVNAQSRAEIVATLLGPTGSTPKAASASPRPLLVSISPQSCASLAAYLH